MLSKNTVLPTTSIKVYDSDGNFICQKYFFEDEPHENNLTDSELPMDITTNMDVDMEVEPDFTDVQEQIVYRPISLPSFLEECNDHKQLELDQNRTSGSMASPCTPPPNNTALQGTNSTCPEELKNGN